MNEVTKMTIEIIIAIVIVPAFVVGLMVFTTNDFSFLSGFLT
jgi:hypothetical protein